MEKKRILCFGDSLTWGYDPDTRTRFPAESRWPMVLQELLVEGWTVIEEGQSGRTIATEDPAEGEKNGLRYVIPCLESQSPLDLMIVMLGGNDLKRKFGYASIDIAGEMQILLEKIQSYNRFRMGDKMKVLLMAPPVIGEEVSDPWLEDCFDFPRARKISRELAGWYVQLAEMYGCLYLDAAQVVRASTIDGVHLEAESHARLARAVYQKLKDEKIVL